MDKTKIHLIIAPGVVSLICIVLAVNAAIFKTQLNAERAKTTSLNRQIVHSGARYRQVADFEAQMSDIKSRYDGLIRDLQYSLDVARREAENAKNEADVLRAMNSDLEARLKTSLKTLENPSDIAETVSGTPASIAE